MGREQLVEGRELSQRTWHREMQLEPSVTWDLGQMLLHMFKFREDPPVAAPEGVSGSVLISMGTQWTR